MKSLTAVFACAIATCVAAGCAGSPHATAGGGRVVAEDGHLPRDEAAEACLAVARSFDEAGRDPQALRLYERAVEHGADAEEVAARMAVLYARADRPADAERMFRVATRRHRRDADVWNDYGYFLLTHGRGEEASRAFGRAVGIDPDHPNARQNLALAESATPGVVVGDTPARGGEVRQVSGLRPSGR